MTILRESMTRITCVGPLGQFNVRIWRYEHLAAQVYHDQLREQVREQIKGKAEPLEIAQLLLAMGGVNAVEVLDAYGDGIVLYKDWP